MGQFSIGGAWSKGVGFVSQHAGGQAAILIGMGIAIPWLLQFLLGGQAEGLANPGAMGPNALAGMAYLGAAALLVVLISYILQTGSYFASWRLGLDAEGNVGAAIVYGLIAAVVLIGIFVAFGVVVALAFGTQLGGGTPPGAGAVVLLLLLLIPLLILFAALYTAVMALVCVGMILVLLLGMAFGGMSAAPNPALAMAGGGAAAILIVLAITLLFFWLTARLSCTTTVMADRGGYNLFSAMAESWRLTSEDQWRILGYLALLGIILCVGFFVFALFVGASMMGGMQGGQPPAMGTGAMIVSLLVSIPFAYLTVLVPAGIYRELYGESPAEVFA
ncbi:MAG TPA: hypothetical protein VLK25_04420 [Allosphingosinicella sp.]|nr:hypothetical protein [Allosphingosinicella sp.]